MVKRKPKLSKPVFIEGLPGIGNVGKIAVDFLIDELKAKKLCSFTSNKFPNSVFVGDDNLVMMPTLELYYKRWAKKDMLLLTGDIQPIDEESCYEFCELLLKIAEEYGCVEVITTGGIGLRQVPEKPKIYCTATDKLMHDRYTRKGLGVHKNIYGVVGPIIGVSGVMLGLAQRKGLAGVALLAETFANPLFLGIKGAKEILRVLEKRFKFGYDLKKLTKEIVELEREVMKKTQEWMAESLPKAGAKLKHGEASYIG